MSLARAILTFLEKRIDNNPNSISEVKMLIVWPKTLFELQKRKRQWKYMRNNDKVKLKGLQKDPKMQGKINQHQGFLLHLAKQIKYVKYIRAFWKGAWLPFIQQSLAYGRSSSSKNRDLSNTRKAEETEQKINIRKEWVKKQQSKSCRWI